MTNIHSLNIFPEQSLINSVANCSDEFMQKDFDYFKIIQKLEGIILNNHFMVKQDYSDWAKKRGCDYFYNPKLFAYAPPTYICAFLSELFKSLGAEKIKLQCPMNVLYQALLRLKCFKQ